MDDVQELIVDTKVGLECAVLRHSHKSTSVVDEGAIFNVENEAVGDLRWV